MATEVNSVGLLSNLSFLCATSVYSVCVSVVENGGKKFPTETQIEYTEVAQRFGPTL